MAGSKRPQRIAARNTGFPRRPDLRFRWQHTGCHSQNRFQDKFDPFAPGGASGFAPPGMARSRYLFSVRLAARLYIINDPADTERTQGYLSPVGTVV